MYIKNDNDKICEFKSIDFIGKLIEEKITSSNAKVIIKEVVSDDNGKIIIEDVPDYYYFNAMAYDNNQPLNVIRFGNYVYVGYYGGIEEPYPEAAITLLFTPKKNITVYIYYVRFD